MLIFFRESRMRRPKCRWTVTGQYWLTVRQQSRKLILTNIFPSTTGTDYIRKLLVSTTKMAVKVNETMYRRKAEKKYSCVVCGLRFHLLQNMQRHLQTHTAANT